MTQMRSSSRAAALILTGALLVAGPARAQAPLESVVLIHVDLAGMMKSELGKLLMSKHSDKMDRNDPEYLNFKAATGIDPETDIQSITIGIAGDLGANADRFYAILDGKFDAARIQSFAKASGKATLAERDGLMTFTPTENPGTGPIPIFAVIDPKTMIIASTEEFSALTGLAKSGKVPTVAAIDKAFKKDDPGQFQVVVALPAAIKEQAKSNPQSAPLANVETIVFTAKMGTDLEIFLKAAADTEANSKSVYDALNGLLAIGRMMSAEQPTAQKVMNDLKLEQAGALTTLSLNVKSADLMTLMDQSAHGHGTQPAGEGEEEGEEEAEAAATPAP